MRARIAACLVALGGCPGETPPPETPQDDGAFFASTLTNRTGETVTLEVAPARFVVDCRAQLDALVASAFEPLGEPAPLADGEVLTLPDAPRGVFPAYDCPAYRVRVQKKDNTVIDRVVILPPSWEAKNRGRHLTIEGAGRPEIATSLEHHAPIIGPLAAGDLPACSGDLPPAVPRWMTPLPAYATEWTIKGQPATGDGCLMLELEPHHAAGPATSWTVCAPPETWRFGVGDVVTIRPAFSLATMLYPVGQGLGEVTQIEDGRLAGVRIDRVGDKPLSLRLERNGVPGGSGNMEGARPCIAVRNGCENIWLEGPAKLGPKRMEFPQQTRATWDDKGKRITVVATEYRWLIGIRARCSPADGTRMVPGLWSGHAHIEEPASAVIAE